MWGGTLQFFLRFSLFKVDALQTLKKKKHFGVGIHVKTIMGNGEIKTFKAS